MVAATTATAGATEVTTATTAAAEMFVATTTKETTATATATMVVAAKAVTSEEGEGEPLGEGARQRLTQAWRKGSDGGTEAN